MGTISEDRYQYCQKCNKARYVKKECDHVWEEVKEYRETIQNGFGIQQNTIFLTKCKNCGEMCKNTF